MLNFLRKNYCCLCKQSYFLSSSLGEGFYLCYDCSVDLGKSRIDQEKKLLLLISSPDHEKTKIIRVHRLFKYTTVVRRLIVQTKVHGGYYSLEYLYRLCQKSMVGLAQEIFSYTQFLPMPSSAWSRIHGKTDLAWLMAEKLAITYSGKFREAPFRLYWHLGKQAFKKSSSRKSSFKIEVLTDGEEKIRQKPLSTLLVFDDVITTGGSLASIIYSFENSADFIDFFVLADAFS